LHRDSSFLFPKAHHRKTEETSNTGNTRRKEGIFGDEAFIYDPVQNIYRCPAGQMLKPRRVHPIRRTLECKASASICGNCVLRVQCTRSSCGHTVQRHEKQESLDRARAQANSPAARRNRKRRQHLMECSFADASNNHHFKRARWRRLWRQQIQDCLTQRSRMCASCWPIQIQNAAPPQRLWRPEYHPSASCIPLHHCVQLPRCSCQPHLPSSIRVT
jgi:DDE family transposase